MPRHAPVCLFVCMCVEPTSLCKPVQAAGADVAPLVYVRTLKRNNLTGAKTGQPSASAGATAADGGLLTSQAHLLDWADKTLGQGLSSVTKGMKSLLSGGYAKRA